MYGCKGNVYGFDWGERGVLGSWQVNIFDLCVPEGNKALSVKSFNSQNTLTYLLLVKYIVQKYHQITEEHLSSAGYPGVANTISRKASIGIRIVVTPYNRNMQDNKILAVKLLPFFSKIRQHDSTRLHHNLLHHALFLKILNIFGGQILKLWTKIILNYYLRLLKK